MASLAAVEVVSSKVFLRGAVGSLLLALGVGCGSRPGDPQGTPQPYPRPAYTSLAETGLYEDLAGTRLGTGVHAYTPAFALWSDGADKQRWIQLPEGAWIDSSDMDRWRFPIGTRVWKEFSRDGVRLETRLIERYGTRPSDYWMGSFVWNEEQTEAVYVGDGSTDVLGTSHDVPSEADCASCHDGEPGRILGFSALQLGAAPAAEEGAMTFERLVREGWLSAPPEGDVAYAPPGDETAALALGYLHANCGHCHNPWAAPWAQTRMLLRLDVGGESLEASPVYQSIVGQNADRFSSQQFPLRVAPGAPDESAIVVRMAAETKPLRMPPLSSDTVDVDGVEIVRRWIAELHD